MESKNDMKRNADFLASDDETLVAQFFEDFHKEPLPDKTFARRVISKLPSKKTCWPSWTSAACLAAIVVMLGIWGLPAGLTNCLYNVCGDVMAAVLSVKNAPSAAMTFAGLLVSSYAVATTAYCMR